jgi:hypothetical protein
MSAFRPLLLTECRIKLVTSFLFDKEKTRDNARRFWQKVVTFGDPRRPDGFARDCVPAGQSKSEEYIRRMCWSKRESVAIPEILARDL